MKEHARMAVFASGGGTNLQSLLDHFNADPDAAARVALVVASKAGIGALDRASRAGVASLVLDPAADAQLSGSHLVSVLERHAIDLVVLAGYIKLVPNEVVERFEGRMVNIHPALLPAFGGPGMYGIRVHRAVIQAGSKVSGATVHLVGTQYDEGPILAQWPVPVLPGDTPEQLAERVLRVEHLLLPLAIEQLLAPGTPTPTVRSLAFELNETSVPTPSSLRILNV